MSLDLTDRDTVKRDLLAHRGCRIKVAYYGERNDPVSVTLECLSCHEVLLTAEDFAKPKRKKKP